MNWPSSFSRDRWWKGEPSMLKENKDYKKQVEKLTSYFAESKAYHECL